EDEGVCDEEKYARQQPAQAANVAPVREPVLARDRQRGRRRARRLGPNELWRRAIPSLPQRGRAAQQAEAREERPSVKSGRRAGQGKRKRQEQREPGNHANRVPADDRVERVPWPRRREPVDPARERD